MDIPAPDKEKAEDEHKVVVKSASTAPKETKAPVEAVPEISSPESSEKTELPSTKADIKDEAFAAEEAKRKNLADMITEKRYFLPIKEKIQSPALTLLALPKKAKKSTPKKQEPTGKKPAKGHQTMLIIILVVILIGTVFAIDAGMIDIGVKLPFDLIKNV